MIGLPYRRRCSPAPAVIEWSVAEAVTLVGGAKAWPLAATARQPACRWHGFRPRSPHTLADQLRAFRQGLKDTGYLKGENAASNTTGGGSFIGTGSRGELVRRRVAVIATTGPAAASARRPPARVVFTTSEGQSARSHRRPHSPGRQPDGYQFGHWDLGAKRLGPCASLCRSRSHCHRCQSRQCYECRDPFRDAAPAAHAMGLQIYSQSQHLRKLNQPSPLSCERPDALFVGNDAFLTSRTCQFSLLAAFHRLPSAYSAVTYKV